MGLLDSPRLRLVVYDPRVQPGGTARDFVTLFDLLDRRAKHIRADEVGQNLRAASDLPSDELNAAVDEYCHVAGIDPDAEWADAGGVMRGCAGMSAVTRHCGGRSANSLTRVFFTHSSGLSGGTTFSSGTKTGALPAGQVAATPETARSLKCIIGTMCSRGYRGITPTKRSSRYACHATAICTGRSRCRCTRPSVAAWFVGLRRSSTRARGLTNAGPDHRSEGRLHGRTDTTSTRHASTSGTADRTATSANAPARPSRRRRSS